MHNQCLKIYNGCIITPGSILRQGTAAVSGDRITTAVEGNIGAPDAITLDARENYVFPGIIVIHVHGGGGEDFMDGREDAFLSIPELHAQSGTTSMVPATLMSDREGILKRLSVYEGADKKNIAGAQFLGMHPGRALFCHEPTGCPGQPQTGWYGT